MILFVDSHAFYMLWTRNCSENKTRAISVFQHVLTKHRNQKNNHMSYYGKYDEIIVQCNLDLVKLYLVTTSDLSAILQRPFFNLQHSIIPFSDIMQFSDSFCRDDECH